MEELNNQSEINAVLEQYQSQLYDISARNPFVNVNPAKLLVLSDSGIDFSAAEKIRTKQNFYLKEYGLETTLKIDLFIRWKQPNKAQFFLSPLLYQRANIKKNQKIEVDYKISISDEEEWWVNPILIHLFKKHFDFDFETNYGSVEEVCEVLKVDFNHKSNAFEETDIMNESQVWQLIHFPSIGTFNYQKSILAHDFDLIKEKPSQSIKQFLGFQHYEVKPKIDGHLDWFPLDTSQKEVVSYAAENSMVIQGPPGTGKSHTIVAAIQNYVVLGKKVLFVSEKKSALEVVYNRLGDLKPLAAYFDAEKNTKLSFYKSLKNAFENASTLQTIVPTDLDEISLVNSKAYPNSTKQVDLVSKVSIAFLETALLKNTAKLKEQHPQSIIPKYSHWQEYEADLKRIEKVALGDWQLKTIGDSAALNINKALFTEQNPLVKIDKKVDELLKDIDLVAQIQSEYGLTISWTDFSKLCLSASILNMVNRNQIDLLFEDTKAAKAFSNLAKKYQTLKNQLSTIVLKNTAWKKRPSISEIEAHQMQMQNSGFLANLKTKRSHKQLFTNYNEDITSVEAGSEILDRLLQEYQLVEKINEVKIKLKHNVGILNPDTEIDFILTVRQKVQSVSHNHYQHILEHEAHEELIGLLSDQHKLIGNVNRIKAYLFNGFAPESVSEMKIFLLDLKGQLSLYQNTLSELKTILNLPIEMINFLRLNKYSIAELARLVIKYELDRALKYQHALKHLTGKDLLLQNQKFNKSKEQVHQGLLKGIYQQSLEKWTEIEQLCTTSHSKLSAVEKETKGAYKKAKRLLVHEMNKTRQLMPVKALFEQADPLLTALQPIWILNPLAIAERLPLIADLFDVVIFDESSQIPVEDALPAIYRSTQLIVVGDSKQMPPSRFFSANEQSPSLLDEAEKVLPAKSLLWHYRSEHPRLIAFSNQQFYDNELKLFPAWQNCTPISNHYIANGVFTDSSNQFEAMAVVQRYKELRESGETDIAIIALSKEQEKCIRKLIIKSNLNLPDSVVLRNLDSVQGIEKRVVLISIGYAKNAEGKLNLNFGPINREQGANRLNVLFSRAIANMEVFTSITAQDIGLSENRGINILRQFLEYSAKDETNILSKSNDFLTNQIQDYLTTNKIEFYFQSEQSGLILDCFTDLNREKILLVNPGINIKDEFNLPSAIGILSARFKTVKIVLNADWIKSASQVQKEVVEFLKS